MKLESWIFLVEISLNLDIKKEKKWKENFRTIVRYSPLGHVFICPNQTKAWFILTFIWYIFNLLLNIIVNLVKRFTYN